MDRKELIKKAYAASSSDRGTYYSEDFQWTDSLGNPPMDRATWLGMGDLMRTSFPDSAFIVEDIQEDGDSFVVTSRFHGTFKKDLDLSPLGMGAVRATGKVIEFPSQRDRVSFENGTISRMQNLETGPDAGLQGFLKAIGAATA